MKWFRRVAFLVLIASSGAAQASSLDPKSIDAIVAPHVADKSFMGEVLVARGADVIFDRSFGRANIEWNVPFAADTRFRIGSMTKQFTAAAVLKLVERGRVVLDAPASRYVSGLPASWHEVTVRQLLNQTAGLPNYTNDPLFATLSRLPTPPAKLLELVAGKPPEFTPGSEWRYSNTNYLVLGCLIEQVSGHSFAAFLRETLFGPLRMTGTDYDSVNRIMPHRASGYRRNAGALENASYTDESAPFSAGGLVSTGRDLLAWGRALYRGGALSPADAGLMIAPAKEEYAFGLWNHERDGIHQIEHGGQINGFNSEMAYYPEADITVIVLSNVEGESAKLISEEIYTKLIPKRPAG
ncbi:serine hydrolase domain-containing protein [Sphingomonas sp.]|uniref:serine hydrolase domain-containing protein n=1 Tax=Sphingomonas sp. TaxID=28214 RepID=UPI003D6D3DBC